MDKELEEYLLKEKEKKEEFRFWVKHTHWILLLPISALIIGTVFMNVWGKDIISVTEQFIINMLVLFFIMFLSIELIGEKEAIYERVTNIEKVLMEVKNGRKRTKRKSV